MENKKVRRRYLAGSMAIALTVSTITAACSSEQGSLGESLEATADETNIGASSAEDAGSAGSSAAPDTWNTAYLAQAVPFEVLSAEERAKIDLEDSGYDAISCFTDGTLYPLYQLAKEQGAVNFLYSPTSLYLALSVLAECEDTEAAAEIYELLGVSGREELTALVSKLTASLVSDGEGDICQIANSLWVEAEYPWYDQAYTTWNLVAENFGADIFQMNLHSEEAGLRKNAWISEHTGGLLGNGSPEPWSEAVRMVILNTVYFDKSWYAPFEAINTNDSLFTTSAQTEVTCSMMHKNAASHDYLETDRYLASTLSYQDGSYMLFMLPMNQLLPEELLKTDLTGAVAAYREGAVKQADLVNFSVPKLDYSVKTEKMEEQLKTMGLSVAFSEEAFQNLTGTGLFVDAISQEARIQVDEEGTKAAAVTEIMAKDTAFLCETVIDMNLNRPYAYAVVSANGTILFAGVVNDPTSDQ